MRASSSCLAIARLTVIALLAAACECRIPGDVVHWVADYCMARLETDDEIAASGCIADELRTRPADDCRAKEHYKEAMCALAVSRGVRAGDVAACVRDPTFVGSTVARGGVGGR